MKLKELLNGIYHKALDPVFEDLEVACMACDSRLPQADGLFVALPGFKFNGGDFIKEAIAQGARVIVKQAATGKTYLPPAGVCVLEVDAPKDFLYQAALRFYKEPSRKVNSVGVTGTNGKTTITYLIESIIHAVGASCGVIGTIN